MVNKTLGFYKKEWRTKNLITQVGVPEGTEYVHYIENGIEYLTSGVYKWSGDRIYDYMSIMVKVDFIDFGSMEAKLKRFNSNSWLINNLREGMRNVQ